MSETNEKKLQKKDKIYISVIVLLLAAVIALTVLLCVSHFQNGKKATEDYYDSKVNVFSYENANYTKGQIIFIGDSITDMYQLDKYYSDLDLAVYNRGISGDTTSGVLGRLKASVFDLEPSKIVLMIGVNDVDWGVDGRTIVSNYRKILDEIKKNQPSVELYFVSVIPQNKKLEELTGLNVTENNEMIIELNYEIFELCEEYGYTYIDLFTLLRDGNGYLRQDCSGDGLHLNDTGYEIWTNLLKPYLEK